MYRSPSVTLSTRPVPNTPYQKRTSQINYDAHLKRLKEIRRPTHPIKPKQPSHVKLLQNLQKYRKASKSLLTNKKQNARKQQNTLIVRKLDKIYTPHTQKLARSVSHNTKLSPIKLASSMHITKKKREEEILESNLVLISNLKQIRKTPKSVKLNMKNEINDYLSLRARLRKNVLPAEKKKHREELSLSRMSSARSSKSLKSSNSVRSLKGYF